jgi:hypothetical protein
MLEIIGGILVPTLATIIGVVTWSSDRSSRHLDKRFSELASMARQSENVAEKTQMDLKELELRITREYITRNEFESRMSESSKKMDYLVEQVDSIKTILCKSKNS